MSSTPNKDVESRFPVVIIGTIAGESTKIPFGSLDDADFYLDHLIFSARRFNVAIDVHIYGHGEEIGHVQYVPSIH